MGGVLGPNLTSLVISTECVHIPFIPSFESSFLHHKSLVLIGEPEAEDLLCLYYLHPNHRAMQDNDYREDMSNFVPLTFECPNLTRLSIRTPWGGDHALHYSLTCPKLIKYIYASYALILRTDCTSRFACARMRGENDSRARNRSEQIFNSIFWSSIEGRLRTSRCI